MILSSPIVLVTFLGLVYYAQVVSGKEDDNCKREVTAADKRDFKTVITDVLFEGDCDGQATPNDDGSVSGSLEFGMDIEEQTMAFRVYYQHDDGDDLSLKAEGSAPAPDFFQKYRPLMATVECKAKCKDEPLKLSTPVKKCENVSITDFEVYPRFFPNNYEKGSYRIELEVGASDNNKKTLLTFLLELV